MKLGDKGKHVKGLQTKLAMLGYDVGKIDGVFGAKTDAAVRKFQMLAELEIDGVVGPITLARLEGNAIAQSVTAAAEDKLRPAFDVNGWYADARRIDVHPGRSGSVIEPKGAVVHTTDTIGGLAGMLKRMHDARGDGGGAHFWIGRGPATDADRAAAYPSNGIVQTVPITRNGNHAGGPNGQHGRVQLPTGAKLHPNSVYVGIELVCGGRLRKMHTKALHEDSGKMVPEAEVFWDERGKPWHTITEYQFEALGALLDALDAHCERLPVGCKLVPNGSYPLNGVTWAALPATRFVTHVALDPIRKTDPGPQCTAWLRERGYASK